MTDWIKCSERMPEETNKFYLVFINDHWAVDYLHRGTPASNNEPVWDLEWHQAVSGNNVSHWMPLFKPPKEEG